MLHFLYLKNYNSDYISMIDCRPIATSWKLKSSFLNNSDCFDKIIES